MAAVYRIADYLAFVVIPGGLVAALVAAVDLYKSF